ncbi:CHASE2 domain-containing protein [Breoghania sp.]|uniref:CHASE2 domain-containing protein n=1 Tax=Breoghania sp. TaxID=2065378 RepID=UPI002608E488|nr:CHASE2 domain-containing protein [Breoghania sp.]MDJ0931927.1 CHASE2 domain-containing protein [Breoghania sp.]
MAEGTRLAAMVERLIDLGAASVAFDIVFSEPDRTSPSRYVETLQFDGTPDAVRIRDLLARLPDTGAQFAKALKDKPVTLGFAALSADSGRIPTPKAGVVFGGTDPKEILPSFGSALASLPELQEAAGRGWRHFAVARRYRRRGQAHPASFLKRRPPLPQPVGRCAAAGARSNRLSGALHRRKRRGRYGTRRHHRVARRRLLHSHHRQRRMLPPPSSPSSRHPC